MTTPLQTPIVLDVVVLVKAKCLGLLVWCRESMRIPCPRITFCRFHLYGFVWFICSLNMFKYVENLGAILGSCHSSWCETLGSCCEVTLETGPIIRTGACAVGCCGICGIDRQSKFVNVWGTSIDQANSFPQFSVWIGKMMPVVSNRSCQSDFGLQAWNWSSKGWRSQEDCDFLVTLGSRIIEYILIV